MAGDPLYQVVRMLPWLVGVAGVVAGLWGVRRLTTEPTRSRPERNAAVRIIRVGSIAGGLGVYGFVLLIGSAWGGGVTLDGATRVIPIGLAAAAYLALTGALGYALVARPRIGRVAVLGVFAGPVLVAGLAAGTATIAVPIEIAMRDAAKVTSATTADSFRDALSVSVTDVQATTFEVRASDGTVRELVERVRLTIVLRTNAPLTLHGEIGQPHAWFYPDAEIGSGFDARLPIDPPYEIDAGETTLVVEESWPERGALVTWPDAPQPGPWTLRLIVHPPGIVDEIAVLAQFTVPKS